MQHQHVHDHYHHTTPVPVAIDATALDRSIMPPRLRSTPHDVDDVVKVWPHATPEQPVSVRTGEREHSTPNINQNNDTNDMKGNGTI